MDFNMISSSCSKNAHRVAVICPNPIESGEIDGQGSLQQVYSEPLKTDQSKDDQHGPSHSPAGNKREFMDTKLTEVSGREKLTKHRVDVAGEVWIPDIWDQEELLKDWIDYSAFSSSLVPNGLMSARAALVEEGRRSNSGGLRLENSC